MSFENLTDDERAQRAELARRVRGLVELRAQQDGSRVTYTLVERLLRLGRSRWEYLQAGNKYLVQEPLLLLAAIAEYFGVDRNYLLELSSVTPERLQAEFAASRRARADQLLATVERTLPDASAELVEQMRPARRVRRREPGYSVASRRQALRMRA